MQNWFLYCEFGANWRTKFILNTKRLSWKFIYTYFKYIILVLINSFLKYKYINILKIHRCVYKDILHNASPPTLLLLLLSCNNILSIMDTFSFYYPFLNWFSLFVKILIFLSYLIDSLTFLVSFSSESLFAGLLNYY